MKYFDFLSDDERREIFFSLPEEIDREANKNILAHALGAALYMPANKANISENILSKKKLHLLKPWFFAIEDANWR